MQPLYAHVLSRLDASNRVSQLSHTSHRRGLPINAAGATELNRVLFLTRGPRSLCSPRALHCNLAFIVATPLETVRPTRKRARSSIADSDSDLVSETRPGKRRGSMRLRRPQPRFLLAIPVSPHPTGGGERAPPVPSPLLVRICLRCPGFGREDEPSQSTPVKKVGRPQSTPTSRGVYEVPESERTLRACL